MNAAPKLTALANFRGGCCCGPAKPILRNALIAKKTP